MAEKEFDVFGKEDMVNAIHDELTNQEDAPASVKEISKKAISAVLDAEKSLIKGAVADGNKVRYIGHGTYEKRERSARKGRNPQTGEEIEIKAQSVPAFKPGKAFKEAVK